MQNIKYRKPISGMIRLYRGIADIAQYSGMIALYRSLDNIFQVSS